MIQITEYLLSKNNKTIDSIIKLGMSADELVEYLKCNGFEEAKSMPWKDHLDQYQVSKAIMPKDWLLVYVNKHRDKYGAMAEYTVDFGTDDKLCEIRKRYRGVKSSIDCKQFMNEIENDTNI